MEELLSIGLLIVLLIGAPLLKRYLEKAQAKSEGARRKPSGGAKPTASGRPVFYGRGEQPGPQPTHLPRMPAPAAPKAGPRTPQPTVAPRQPARPSRQPTQRAVQRSAPAAAKPAARKSPSVATIAAPGLGSAGIGSLRERGAYSPAARGKARAPVPASTPLTDLLRGGNLARAFVVSEILGPPKALKQGTGLFDL